MCVSVAMATFNGERYIEEQLRSIVCQLSEGDEVILSDDGSTDGTLRIAKKVSESFRNIRIVEGPRKGVIKNFENALRHSRNELIFLSDQDDVWLRDKVLEVKRAMEDGSDLIIHDAYFLCDGVVDRERSFFAYRGSKPGFLNNIIKNSYVGCCMAFNRRVLEQSLPIPDDITMHDQWIGLIAERTAKIRFLNIPLIYYRRHDTNVSSLKPYPLPRQIGNRVRLIRRLIEENRRCAP